MIVLDCWIEIVINRLFEKYTVLLIVKCTSVRGRKKAPTHTLLRFVLFCVKGCLLGGGFFCATVSSKSRRDWKREESARGNDEKREAVSLRSFYFLVFSFFFLVGASANEVVIKRFVSDVVLRLNKSFFAGLHVFPTFVLTEFPLVLTLTLGVVSVKVGNKRRNV